MRDCFAYKNRKCLALTVTKCQGIECSFYKTKEQAKEDEDRAIKRILSLDKERIQHINESYYEGKLEVD